MTISPARALAIRIIAAFVLFIGSFLAPQPALAAGCAGVCQSNEILVGQDKDSCYCRDLQDYKTCVAKARRRFEAKVGSCESVLACLRRNNISDQAGLCAAATLVIPLTWFSGPGAAAALPAAVAGTGITCTWLSLDGFEKAKTCVNTTTAATCKAEALEMIKADLEDCKSD